MSEEDVESLLSGDGDTKPGTIPKDPMTRQLYRFHMIGWMLYAAATAVFFFFMQSMNFVNLNLEFEDGGRVMPGIYFIIALCSVRLVYHVYPMQYRMRNLKPGSLGNFYDKLNMIHDPHKYIVYFLTFWIQIFLLLGTVANYTAMWVPWILLYIVIAMPIFMFYADRWSYKDVLNDNTDYELWSKAFTAIAVVFHIAAYVILIAIEVDSEDQFKNDSDVDANRWLIGVTVVLSSFSGYITFLYPIVLRYSMIKKLDDPGLFPYYWFAKQDTAGNSGTRFPDLQKAHRNLQFVESAFAVIINTIMLIIIVGYRNNDDEFPDY